MYEYGPHEYYHNENIEPMFRGIKVRNLAEMFSNEENYWDYTLNQFKEWLKKKCPEEDWTYINEWGRLSQFDSIALENKDIFDYLFQLGMDPIYTYINCIGSIKGYEKNLKRDNQKYISESLQEAQELLEVCKKYMSYEDIIHSLDLKEYIKIV